MLIFSSLVSGALADDLSTTFKQPVEETKPWCYWYWLGGDIAAEGITKDLEKMAEIGISRAMIGTIAGANPKTNNAEGEVPLVKVLSPEWHELKMHALREGKRLGVDLYFFNGPGWSQSGGPWISHTQSMRRVQWQEIEAKGGAFKQQLRPRGTPSDGSQDIAVLAVPKRESVSVKGELTENRYTFAHTAPFTARSLQVEGALKGTLFAIRNGKREPVCEIDVEEGVGRGNFIRGGYQPVSFADVKADRFELEFVPQKMKSQKQAKVILSSEPKVARVLSKQLGRMPATASPSWDAYIFDETVEPGDASALTRQSEIIDLSDKIDANGYLICTLPEGDWRVIYFGMRSTNKRNGPAPDEARGQEVDKMSRKHTQHHFDSYIGKLLEKMGPEEKAAFKGITIDSYEAASQNWTDGFAAEFEKRNGYSPIKLLPVFTGTVVDSAKTSDQFLWDLRRTVADLIAENYLAGLRDAAHKHDLVLWCEPYGHAGFPGDFTVYGGHADQVGGEFWTESTAKNKSNKDCRAASSVAHLYGKRRTYAEAFTSVIRLNHHPYFCKRAGDVVFATGINHFVLHVYVHQPRTGGMPGKNPGFGTAFHRNTPWFNESRSWIEYLQRNHTMLQWGDPANDVLVYIGDFAPQMTGPPSPVPFGYQFDYVGSDAILRKLDVVDGEWVTYDETDPTRIFASWPVMTIPSELKHIRPHIRKRLGELIKKGGKVIRSVPVSAEQLGALNIKPAVSDTSCPVLWIERKLKDQRLFFLSNFERTGSFTATLRVKGKQPELMNPVAGEIKTIARYEETVDGTRVEIDVKDPADSFFVLFREKPAAPAVVKASASVTELDLFYNDKNRLVAETGNAGSYTLTMSDGTTRSLTVEEGAKSFDVAGWKTTSTDNEGFTEIKTTEFNLPSRFAGKGQRVYLDLGKVEIMARVTLNGKTRDTLWMPPFVLDVTDWLKPGKNRLAIRVTSTSTGRPKIGDPIQLKTRTRKELQ